MRKIERVAIFSQGVSHQMSQTTGLKRGFETLGIEAYTGFSLLDGNAMAFFIDEYRPDIVIEINRSRDQIPNCTTEFNHVSWIWDYNLNDMLLTQGFGGSALNFFIINPTLTGHIAENVEPWAYLLPGVDPDLFSPTDSEFECDFSIIGYLPGPITREEKAMPITHAGRQICTLGDIIDAFEHYGLRQHHIDQDKMIQIVTEVIQRQDSSFGAHSIPPKLLIHLEDRWNRTTDRVEFLEDILSVSKNVRFYGYGGWHQWETLAPFYAGPIFNNTDKANIYRKTRINLHNGSLGMHDRVLEAMSCSSTVLLNDSPIHDGETGINKFFENGIDFAQCEIGDAETAAHALLSNPTRVAEIGASARQKILAAHTWRHRAEQILAELEKNDIN